MFDAFQIFKVSIHIVFKYFGIAFRYCVGWAVLIAALYYAMHYVVPEGTNLYRGIYSFKGLLFNAAICFIYVIAFVSCSINWHRFVLLDEKPKGLFSIPPMDIVLSYFLKSAIIASLIVTVAVISWLVLSYVNPLIYELTGAHFLPEIYYPIIQFFVLYFFMRLGILLCVVAIGDANFTLVKSWALSKNIKNTIFYMTAFFVVLWFVVNEIANEFADIVNSYWQSPKVFELIYFVTTMILSWFIFITFIGLITFLYAKALEVKGAE